jgi:hypothetical protein
MLVRFARPSTQIKKETAQTLRNLRSEAAKWRKRFPSSSRQFHQHSSAPAHFNSPPPPNNLFLLLSAVLPPRTLPRPQLLTPLGRNRDSNLLGDKGSLPCCLVAGDDEDQEAAPARRQGPPRFGRPGVGAEDCPGVSAEGRRGELAVRGALAAAEAGLLPLRRRARALRGAPGGGELPRRRGPTVASPDAAAGLVEGCRRARGGEGLLHPQPGLLLVGFGSLCVAVLDSRLDLRFTLLFFAARRTTSRPSCRTRPTVRGE